MTVKCGCGGRYRRTDIKAVWSEELKRTVYADIDPLVAHWKCDGCKSIRTQRKRQGKANA